MRVTQSMLYRQTLDNMQQRQAQTLARQNEIASGRRLNQAMDDPAAMGRVLRNDDRQLQMARYGDNIGVLSGRLGFMESELAGATDLIHRARELTLAGANASQSQESLATLAAELRALGESMLQIGNSRDGQGRYLFAGFDDGEPAFAELAGAVTYLGAASSRSIPIDDARQLDDGLVGEAVFLNGPAGDLFAMFDDLADALTAPNASAAEKSARAQGVADGLDRLDDALDHVLGLRAGMGIDLQRLDEADQRLQTLDIELQKDTSNLRDTDIAQAVSDLSQQMTMLEAARKTFVQIQGLSLFNFLR